MTTTLLTGIVTTTEEKDGYSVQSFNATGEPDRNAFVDLVAACLRDLPAGIVYDEPVTFLRYGHTMFGASQIVIEEGRFFDRSGRIAFLPKGRRNRGFSLKQSDILAVRRGFNQGDALRAVVDDLTRVLPEVTPLTQDDLNALPTRGGTCTLAAAGTSPFFSTRVPGVWLLHSYLPEADIAEGVFVVADGFGAVTEHGSVYGRDLLRQFAKAGPIAVPLAEALDFTFDRALAVTTKAVA